MTNAEYIAALQRDLIEVSTTVERLERELAAAKETIKATVTRAIEAEQRVEAMRVAIANVVSTAHVVQRIAAGEKE